jgi:hypothetical protein
MIPVCFPESNAVLAASQEEYEPMAVHVFGDPRGTVAFCCRLSDAEVEEIVRTRTIWARQLTFGRGFQPIALSTQKPEGMS